MRDNGDSAEKAQGEREVPAFAKKKEIKPETESGELRGEKQRVVSVEMENRPDQGGKNRVRREECDIRNFHHFVIRRRNRGAKAAVNDVGEPVAVVLNECAVAISERPFGRCGDVNGNADLGQRQNQSRDETLQRGGKLHALRTLRAQRRHQSVFDCKAFSVRHGRQFQIVFVSCAGRDFLVASLDDAARGLFARTNPDDANSCFA